jgi:hypothetical protein
MSCILDQSQDVTGQERHRIQQVYTLPGFVKTASHADTCGDTLQPRDYADQCGRLYPMHTGPATCLSAAFFFDKRASLDASQAAAIEARLDERAEFFDVSNVLTAMRKQADSNNDTQLTTLSDDNFAYVAGDGDAKQRFMPLRNAGEVKAASAWLETYRDRFAFRTRQRIAGRLLEKAARFGAAIANVAYVEKQAGFGVCPSAHAAELLRSRIPYIVGPKEADFRDEIEKTAQRLVKHSSDTRDPSNLCKLAALVDEIDRVHNLKTLYGKGLQRPEEVLFSVTQQKAAAFLETHVNLTNGAVFDKEALGRMRVHDVRERMGDFADAVTSDGIHVDVEKVAEMAYTLPRRDADTFQSMCRALGVLPVTVKAASQRQGLAPAETQALAAAYQPVTSPMV